MGEEAVLEPASLSDRPELHHSVSQRRSGPIEDAKRACDAEIEHLRVDDEPKRSISGASGHSLDESRMESIGGHHLVRVGGLDVTL